MWACWSAQNVSTTLVFVYISTFEKCKCDNFLTQTLWFGRCVCVRSSAFNNFLLLLFWVMDFADWKNFLYFLFLFLWLQENFLIFWNFVLESFVVFVISKGFRFFFLELFYVICWLWLCSCALFLFCALHSTKQKCSTKFAWHKDRAQIGFTFVDSCFKVFFIFFANIHFLRPTENIKNLFCYHCCCLWFFSYSMCVS